MKFDDVLTAPCIIQPTPPVDPRCSDAAFNLANPALCSSVGALIIKPSSAFCCQFESVNFRLFEFKNGLETEIAGTFESSDDTVFAVGVATGNGTGLTEGSVTITATSADGRTVTAQVTVLPAGTCCDEISVFTSLAVDNSRSMGLNFGNGYTTRLDFAKAVADSYAGIILAKDSDQVWFFNEVTGSVTNGFVSDVAAITDDVAEIEQTQQKTSLLGVFTTITDDLLANSADRRVLLLISDGEHTFDSDRQAVLDAASTFRGAGGIVIVIGCRASGVGYDLLERVASGGFFLNATADNIDEVLAKLSYLKSLLCAGDCVPAGDTYENQASLDYSSFTNFEVTAGQVNLIGGDLLNLLDIDGLYVEMAGPAPATIRTIDTYSLVAGNSYRVSFRAAGNQREDIAEQLKMYLREVGANDSDPNIFEATASPAYDAPLTLYSFTFTAISDVTVRLYFEQLYTGTPPTVGNLLDDVLFEDVTNAVTLLDDDFDGENLVYIPPRCGQSAAQVGIDNPSAPTVEQVAVASDPNTEAFWKYTYGYSWVTAHGETAAAITVFTPGNTEHNLPGRRVTLDTPPADVVSVRIWRSLGEGHTIELANADTASVNGSYIRQSATLWNQDGGTNRLEYDSINAVWNILNAGDAVVYSCSPENFPIGPWEESGLGAPPTPEGSVTFEADAGVGAMFLLAEISPADTIYIDSEGRAAFENRYDNSVTAPTVNTTDVAAGELGAAYYDCCYYDACPDCNNDLGVQSPDPLPLADIETGTNPPGIFTATVEQCFACVPGFTALSVTNLVPTMTSATAPSGEASASDEFDASTAAWKAFDGDAATHWLSSAAGPWTLQYQFAAAQTVMYYALTPYHAPPKSWTFEGSNDGATWTVLDTRENIAGWSGYAKRFMFENATAYLYYRLNISESYAAGSDAIAIASLEMFAEISQMPCATVTRTGATYQEAYSAAKTAALDEAGELAADLLICLANYMSTQSYTATCPGGTFGASVTRQATRYSLNSQSEADSAALAAATEEANDALDCTGSNNTQQIVINDRTGTDPARATPYPSVCFKSGLTGTITKVTATIIGFNAGNYADVAILLVSPAGTGVYLLGNCMDAAHDSLERTITFDDDATDSVPQNARPGGPGNVTFDYKPTVYVGQIAPFPTPAPNVGLYDTTLSAFIGEDPNGAWQLYVVDDTALGTGYILSGWTISITSA